MPRCLNCKTKFEPRYFLQKFCLGSEVCIDAATKHGKEKASLKMAKESKEREKHIDLKVKEMKIDTHSKEHRNTLQDLVNALARKIDQLFCYDTCIDCDRKFGKQIDACHLHSRGANSTIKYNLHNLHSGRSECNQWSDLHHSGYKVGLQKRYGLEYLQRVENLPIQYKSIKLSNLEVYEKLRVVRLLIRTAHTFKFNSAIEARDHFNSIINIYN